MQTAPIDTALLRRYDRPGPRYTSYPTAVEFHPSFTATDYISRLQSLNLEEPLSLYLHLPFCEHRCSFCGCNVVITRKREVAARYLQYLEREMALVHSYLGATPRIAQYHWGGGTPTYFAPEQIRHLHQTVEKHFTLLADAERAIEIDPRVTTPEHIDVLAELGFNRLSMGVQDFTPEVQAAIERNQDEGSTRQLFAYCRQRGFNSINVDLIYGLPLQTPSSFADNLNSILALKPERIALYSYAHVPWIKGHQKKIDTDLLPSGATKMALFVQALEALTAGGYEQIGMDHFALPDDELSRAVQERKLHRNFMGYTVERTTNTVALGISAIGDIDGAFVQNAKKLSTYYRALDADQLPVEKGYELSNDDELRRFVIAALMCNFYLDITAVEARFGIDFADYFAEELAELATGPAADGLLEIGGEALIVMPSGRLFIRNICMSFDRYLRDKTAVGPTFSRTV